MKNKGLIIFLVLLITFTFFSGCGDPEKEARASFNKAQVLIREGKGDEGKKLLNEVISKYPETKVATDANNLLNEMYAAKALTKAFKNEEIEAHNRTVKIDLKSAGLAQECYFIDNMSYSKSLNTLIGKEYEFYVSDGVMVSIKHANSKKYIMESYHNQGTKTYILSTGMEAPMEK